MIAMPSCYSKVLIIEYENNKTLLPICRYLMAEDISGSISADICFVIWHRHRFLGYNLKYFPDGALIYGAYI